MIFHLGHLLVDRFTISLKVLKDRQYFPKQLNGAHVNLGLCISMSSSTNYTLLPHNATRDRVKE